MELWRLRDLICSLEMLYKDLNISSALGILKSFVTNNVSFLKSINWFISSLMILYT